MSVKRLMISTLWLLILSVWTVFGQDECAVDVSTIINRVTEDCAAIGENEVCYGNRNVRATARVNTVDFQFENPGDLADLYNIQSLVVDAVDSTTNEWGVAQMRLLVGSDAGLQDMTMLLFGEFDIENAVPDTRTLEFQVVTNQKSIYLLPDVNSNPVGIANSGTVLTATARLEDNQWLRVENLETRVSGWVQNDAGLEPLNEALTIGILPMESAQSPAFGAMQAFYFENGNSDIGCDTVESDGLLIQTPEGQARISLLINEVSIELVGSRNSTGGFDGSTALVQADRDSGTDMEVSVLEGQANVITNNGSQSVTSGERTSIPLSVDLRSPIGAPAEPVTFNTESSGVAPLLPAVSAPLQAAQTLAQNNTTTGASTGTGGSGSGNNTGGNVSGNVTGSNGNNTNGSSGNNSNFTVETTNNTSSSNSDGSDFPLSDTTGASNGRSENALEQAFGDQADTVALTSAIVAMVLLIFYIVRSARRHN